MIYRVLITSTKEAALRKSLPGHAVISITDPGRENCLGTGWPYLLHLSFVDAEPDENPRDIQRGQLDGSHVHFSREQAQRTRGFLHLCEISGCSTVLVHCEEGKRRAAAVARYACEVLELPFNATGIDYNRLVYHLLHDPGRHNCGLGANPAHVNRRPTQLGFWAKTINTSSSFL